MAPTTATARAKRVDLIQRERARPRRRHTCNQPLRPCHPARSGSRLSDAGRMGARRRLRRHHHPRSRPARRDQYPHSGSTGPAVHRLQELTARRAAASRSHPQVLAKDGHDPAQGVRHPSVTRSLADAATRPRYSAADRARPVARTPRRTHRLALQLLQPAQSARAAAGRTGTAVLDLLRPTPDVGPQRPDRS
jgi:hypothetical protein